LREASGKKQKVVALAKIFFHPAQSVLPQEYPLFSLSLCLTPSKRH